MLFYFVENVGRVAKKSELLDAVWTDTYIEESTLARNVSWLRNKLSECADGEPIIETVPKLGYRFTAEVTRPENNGNSLIVEEQTVQYFHGEETITHDDATVERRSEWENRRTGERVEGRTGEEENKIAALPNVSLSPFILAAFGLIALAGIGFIIYQNYFKTAAPTTDLNVEAKIIVKHITVDAARETVDTGIQVQPGDIIDVSADGEYQPGTDQTWTYEGDKTAKVAANHTFQNADPWSLVGWIGTKTDQNDYFQVSKSNAVTAERTGSLYFAVNDWKNNYADNRGELIIAVTLTRSAVTGNSPIKIGSIVNLQNRYPNEGGYLDAWGLVRNKPEFVRQVPTETMFVSTHQNPNRDSGSGSWEIVSATGKKNNETLVYGDEIHLRSRHPDADYLDNCGWIIDMPIYKDFVGVEKFAVFTTYSKDRDNGTGTWIVKSDTQSDGSPVLEEDGISLENGFPGGGFLDTAGRVSSIPAFNDYDGSLLVFIHESSTSYPNSGIWTITTTKAVLK